MREHRQPAGRRAARLALALGRPTGTFWVLCGPGNNGGDGLVAARWLHRQGQAVRVILAGSPEHLPPDARQAWLDAQAAGVPFTQALPPHTAPVRAVIDALLGLGQIRPLEGRLAELAGWCNQQTGPVLSVDLPSGMNGDTGQPTGEVTVQAQATLSLLTLKPGLFTGQGRDLAGALWWDDLGIRPDHAQTPATAWITGEDEARSIWPRRQHAQPEVGGAFAAGRCAQGLGHGRRHAAPGRPPNRPKHPRLRPYPGFCWREWGCPG